jgi:IclR family mhp operon transcriptional activator
VTAIGFPVRIGEHAIGAINLVLQNNVVSEREIATRYVPLLRSLADDISKGAAELPRE